MSPSAAGAKVPAGFYSGTMHSYCPSFDYHDSLVLTVYADGTAVVVVPARGGSFDSQGTVGADDTVSGLSIQVNSLSRGHLTIPYTLQVQADGTLAGSGVSGDIKLDVAAKMDTAFTSTVEMTAVTPTGPSSTLSVAEGGPKTVLTVTRSGEDFSAPLTVTYKAKGTAEPGVNYKSLKGVVTIPAGQASAKFKLTTFDDGVAGDTHTLNLKLTASDDGSYAIGANAKVKVLIHD